MVIHDVPNENCSAFVMVLNWIWVIWTERENIPPLSISIWIQMNYAENLSLFRNTTVYKTCLRTPHWNSIRWWNSTFAIELAFQVCTSIELWYWNNVCRIRWNLFHKHLHLRNLYQEISISDVRNQVSKWIGVFFIFLLHSFFKLMNDSK